MSNKLLRTSDPTVHGPHRGLGGVGSGLLPRGNSWFRGGFGKKKGGGEKRKGRRRRQAVHPAGAGGYRLRGSLVLLGNHRVNL